MILYTLANQGGDLPSTGKSCISNQIGWEQAQKIDLLMLHLGKIHPAKTNSGISHNIGKNYLETYKNLNYVGRRGKPSTWLPRQKLAEERSSAHENHFRREGELLR